MSIFDGMVTSGADGFLVARLPSYKLTKRQLGDLLRGSAAGLIAFSRSPDVSIETYAYFHTTTYAFGVNVNSLRQPEEFHSLKEAMAHHDELSAPILERIAVMEANPSQALADGAL